MDREALTAERKQKTLEAVKHGFMLRCVNKQFRDDRDVVLEAVKRSGESLRHASAGPRADKDVVLEAVKQKGDALRFASDELRADREVVMEAVKQNGASLRFAGEKVRANKEVVLEAIKHYSGSLKVASSLLQADKDLLLLVVRSPFEGFSPEGLAEDAKAVLEQQNFQQAKATALAVQGEPAPILTVTLSHQEDQGLARFECEASLMSGTTISCSLLDLSGSSAGSLTKPEPRGLARPTVAPFARKQRVGPTLADLAEKLVATLPKTTFETVNRVFINFVNEDTGDCVVVSPWDWERPLADFLPKTR